MVVSTGLKGLYDSVTRWKQRRKGKGGEEWGCRNVEKNVLAMKCNKNVNIPYCEEYLSVKTGIVWCCWYSCKREEYRDNLAI